MKRIISVIFLAMILFLTSCSEKSTYEKIISQLEKSDFDQSVYYDEDMIKEITDKFSSMGITLNGKVDKIVHFTKIGKTDNEWVYVYSFEFSDDANTFMEKYASNWENAIIKGTVVVYGESSVIDEIHI